MLLQNHIDYGSLTWGGATNTHLLKLKQTLSKVMRIMAFRSMNQLNPYIFTIKYHHLKQTQSYTRGTLYIRKLTQNQHPDYT